MAASRPLPTRCIEENPAPNTIRLGGVPINLTRLCEHGMDHGYLSHILSGQRIPSVVYGRKVAKCLGILQPDGSPDFTGLLQLIQERVAELEAQAS